MTEKKGYIIGIILGITIYSFSKSFILGNLLSYQIQIFLDYTILTLSILAIIMGAAIVFKKIHIKTTSRGTLFGIAGTVAIMEWIIGPSLLN